MNGYQGRMCCGGCGKDLVVMTLGSGNYPDKYSACPCGDNDKVWVDISFMSSQKDNHDEAVETCSGMYKRALGDHPAYHGDRPFQEPTPIPPFDIQPKSDAVNHPPHYTSHPSGVECIRITEHMNFNKGNALKYLWRSGEKDAAKEAEDLKKAAWYIQREIARITGVKE